MINMKVSVISGDRKYKKWTIPFIGILVSLTSLPDGSVHGIVVHPDDRLLVVPIHLIRRTPTRPNKGDKKGPEGGKIINLMGRGK